MVEQVKDGSIVERFVTLLAINPEPLILTAFSAKEPSFTSFLGACGRVAAFTYAGVPLTDVYDRPWLDRASYSLQLLQIASRLTSGSIKLYLTDPRPDNFVVDEENKVWLVDAENIILVDSLTDGLAPKEHQNDGLGCLDCLSFDPDDLCNHTTADHNYFAVWHITVPYDDHSTSRYGMRVSSDHGTVYQSRHLTVRYDGHGTSRYRMTITVRYNGTVKSRYGMTFTTQYEGTVKSRYGMTFTTQYEGTVKSRYGMTFTTQYEGTVKSRYGMTFTAQYEGTVKSRYGMTFTSLLSSTPFERDIPGGMLHDVPPWVTMEFPPLSLLVEICSYPVNSPYRHLTETHLVLPSPREQELHLRNSLVFHSETKFVKETKGNFAGNYAESIDGCSELAAGKAGCSHSDDLFDPPNFLKMSRGEAAKKLMDILQKILARHP
ncbi:FAM69 protein-kinase domain [Trinorchestia longiramus]|nr:FAM69 protein-kinase domain [Trinorchestia longiramus]